MRSTFAKGHFRKTTEPVCGNSSVGRARPCQGRGREFESRFPLQIFQTPQKTKTYLVFKCDPLMGPRPSVGQIPISFPAPNFQKSRRLKHNIVVSMRPLKGPATECRPLLHNENKSVFHSKFSYLIFLYLIINVNFYVTAI